MNIGVTGHRQLPSSAELGISIRHVLEELRDRAHSRGEPLVLHSALAEGADRLVASIALGCGEIELRALLPLPRDDYARDFQTPESLGEFADLINQAAVVEALPACRPRTEAYRTLGQELVLRCDVILAVWDGRPARGGGGTADVVALARGQGRPLIWVQPQDPPEIVWEGIEDL